MINWWWTNQGKNKLPYILSFLCNMLPAHAQSCSSVPPIRSLWYPLSRTRSEVWSEFPKGIEKVASHRWCMKPRVKLTFGYRECSCFSAVLFEFDPVSSSMQDQCRISSQANDGGTVLEQQCVTDDSSSVFYPARMRIYARDEQHNFQHLAVSILLDIPGVEEYMTT